MEYPWTKKTRNQWNKRSKIVSNILFKNIKVLDVGGGLGNIKKFLNGCSYMSIDLQKWTKDTVVVDMNKESPELGKFDVIICQGVLEYIDDANDFFDKMHKYGDTMILTYRVKNENCGIERNDISHGDVRKSLQENNWHIESENDGMVKSEKIYYCKHYGK